MIFTLERKPELSFKYIIGTTLIRFGHGLPFWNASMY